MAFLNLPKDLVVGARASAYIDEATCHLHAGHDFEAGHFQVDGKNPLPECDLGPLQCRPDPDRECLPAAGAVVRQSGRPGGLTRVRASAPWAMATFGHTKASNHVVAASSSRNMAVNCMRGDPFPISLAPTLVLGCVLSLETVATGGLYQSFPSVKYVIPIRKRYADGPRDGQVRP